MATETTAAEGRPTVYLDMDGVCCDWAGAVARQFGYPDILKDWPAGTQWLHDRLGVSEKELWEVVDDCGTDLWLELQPFDHFRALYDGLVGLADVFILTSPGCSEFAAAGKVMWLKRHIGPTFDRFILTRHKAQLARPGAILIDDWDDHISAWNAAGGFGMLFPAPWNVLGHHRPDAWVNMLLDKLTFEYVTAIVAAKEFRP